jgi:hypothetical protein
MILMGISLLGLVPSTAKSLRAQLEAGKIAPAEVSINGSTHSMVRGFAFGS